MKTIRNNFKMWTILGLLGFCILCASVLVTAFNPVEYGHAYAMTTAVEQEQNNFVDNLDIELESQNNIGIDPLWEVIDPPTPVMVSGRILWQTRYGDILPLRHVRIGNHIGSSIFGTYTDANGFFSSNLGSFFGSNSVTIRINAQSYTFRIANSWATSGFTTYNISIQRSFNANGGNPVVISINYTIRYDSDGHFYGENNYRAIAMSQGFVMAQQFAFNMGMSRSGFVRIAYPANFDFCFEISGIFNNFSVMGIRYGGWHSWRLLFHEYAHFVQFRMGIYGNRDILMAAIGGWFEWGRHLDLIHEKNYKLFGAQLAWQEGWAIAFEYMVREYFRNTWLRDIDNTWVNENNHPARPIHDPEANSPNYRIFDSGEGQPSAIAYFLWRQYLGGNQVRINEFWAETTVRRMYTFSDYIQRLLNTTYQNNLSRRNTINRRLETLQMAPTNIVITQVGLGIPTISWTNHGSRNTPLNRFRIAFFCSRGTLRFQTAQRRKYGGHMDRTSHTLSAADWDRVREQFPNNERIHVSVHGYHNAFTLNTGAFGSRTQPLTEMGTPGLVFSGRTVVDFISPSTNFSGTIKIPAGITAVRANIFPVGVNINWVGVIDFDTNIENIGLGFEVNSRNIIVNNFVIPPHSAILPPFRGTISIPEGVTSIAANVFSGNQAIYHVHIPSTVHTIGTSAFENATNLLTVEFAEGSRLSHIGAHAFRNSALMTARLPRRVHHIGASAFENTRLRHIILPPMLSYVAPNAFRNIEGTGHPPWDSRIFFEGTPQAWQGVWGRGTILPSPFSVYFYSANPPRCLW